MAVSRGPVTAMALRKAGLGVRLFEALRPGLRRGRGVPDPGGERAGGAAGSRPARPRGRPRDGHARGGDGQREGPRTGRHPAAEPDPAAGRPLPGACATRRSGAGCTVEYGKRLTDAAVTDGGVQARFEDGTTADGALLVGADGLWSRTRTIIDPGAPRPRHLGLLNTGGFAEGYACRGGPASATSCFGRRCFFGYLIHPDGEVWWFANPASPKEPTTRGPGRRHPGGADRPVPRRRRADARHHRGDAPRHAGLEHLRPADRPDLVELPHGDRRRRRPRDLAVIRAGRVDGDRGRGRPGAVPARPRGARGVRRLRAAAPGARGADRRAGQTQRRRKGARPVGAYLRDLFLPVVLRQVAKRGALSWMYDHRIAWDESV